MKLRLLVLAWLGLGAAMDAFARQPPEAQMPADIKALHDSTGGQIEEMSRCEVLDWIVDPAHGWPTMPTGPVDMARRYLDVCNLGIDGVTAESVAARLGAETFRIDVEGNVLTVLAKTDQPEAGFCCAPGGALSRIDESSYWAARYRIADADRAMISLILSSAAGPINANQWKTYRGPNAPPKPVEVETGEWKGQMLDRELKSEALGETRKLRIYLPPGYAKDRKWPALFMADAGAIEFAGLVEAMIAAGEIRPIVIVSAESGEQGVVGEAPMQYGDLRAAEYLPGTPKGAARFSPHLTFFSKELVDYAVNAFGVSQDRKDRAVAGKSNGGVFALWAGVIKPDVFANAIAMSPGWKPLAAGDTNSGPRACFFISAGMYEPPFIMSAKNSEAVLKAAGYDVTARYYAAGHYHDQWAIALREALLQIFPAR